MLDTYLDLWDTKIPLKSKDCYLNNIEGDWIQPKINVYVKLTSDCNSFCPFCQFRPKKQSFNAVKFIKVITELNDNIPIGKISFTGGEPTLYPALLNSLLWAIKGMDNNIFTVVSTNGSHLNNLDTNLIDSISLSRHHYMSSVNKKIFNREIEDSWDRSLDNKLHLTCNLIKGYIDSSKEIFKYLNTYASLGITDFGFVNLMPLTTWAIEHRLTSEEDAISLLSNVPNTIKTHSWHRRNSDNNLECCCNNFETTIFNKKIYSYARATINTKACESLLVFDVDHLTLGFNGPTIL